MVTQRSICESRHCWFSVLVSHPWIQQPSFQLTLLLTWLHCSISVLTGFDVSVSFRLPIKRKYTTGVYFVSFPFAFFCNSRLRRQVSSLWVPVKLQVELRDEPRASSTATTGIGAEILSNIASMIINRFQWGELSTAWRNMNMTPGFPLSNMSVQEPFEEKLTDLNVINRTELIVSPDYCREQSPCSTQPLLVAYDSEGQVIQKLGSGDRPWQVKASVVGRPNLVLPGGIANYSNGQTQFTLFGLPSIGSYQIQFTFIQPDGISRYAKSLSCIVQKVDFCRLNIVRFSSPRISLSNPTALSL